MSYSSFTDAGTDMGISGQTSKLGNGATFGKNTRLQDDGSSSYDTYSKSDPSDRPVKFRRSSVRGAVQDGPSPATRDYTRSLLRKATEASLQLTDASDPIGKANAGFDVLEILEALWGLRQSREPDWGDLVNILQTILRGVDMENLTRPQCAAIRKVIEEQLAGVPMDTEEMARSLDVLQRTGLDPWVGISGDPASGD